MARLLLENHVDVLLFCDGVIPSSNEIFQRMPRRVGMVLPLLPLPVDEEQSRAYLLNFHAYQIAHRRGYRLAGPPPETWMLRNSEISGVLARWFEGKPDGYRLMVHRYHKGSQAPSNTSSVWGWCDAYTRLGIRHRSRAGGPLLTGPHQLLAAMLTAYAVSPEAVESAVRSTGYPFVRSTLP